MDSRTLEGRLYFNNLFEALFNVLVRCIFQKNPRFLFVDLIIYACWVNHFWNLIETHIKQVDIHYQQLTSIKAHDFPRRVNFLKIHFQAENWGCSASNPPSPRLAIGSAAQDQTRRFKW